MASINQLVRKPRQKVKVKSNVPALQGCPQKRGVCVRVYNHTKKQTRLCERLRVRLTNKQEVTAYIGGEATIFRSTVVLIRGARVKVASVLSIVRVADTTGVSGRKRGRSKYGAKKPKDS